MAALQAQDGINDLRTQAHLALSARLRALDLTPLFLWTPSVAPSALPFLAWQFDVLGPYWSLLAATDDQLSIVQNAIGLHRMAGTPAAIEAVVENVGLTLIGIDEGQNSWGGDEYPSDQGWALFRVNVLLADAENSQQGTAQNFDSVPDVDYIVDFDLLTYLTAQFTAVPWSAAQQAALVGAINFFKPMRCLLDQVNYEAVGVTDQFFMTSDAPPGSGWTTDSDVTADSGNTVDG